MAPGGLKVIVDEPGRRGGAEVPLPSEGGGDDGEVEEHGLRHRQAKPLAARRRHQSLTIGVELTQLRIGQVRLDQDDPPEAGEPSVSVGDLLLHTVVEIRKGLDDQAHALPARERTAKGLQKDVHAFLGEPR